MNHLFFILLLISGASVGASTVKVKIELDPAASKKLFEALDSATQHVQKDDKFLPSEGGSHFRATRALPEAGITCTHEKGAHLDLPPFEGYGCEIHNR